VREGERERETMNEKARERDAWRRLAGYVCVRVFEKVSEGVWENVRECACKRESNTE